MEAQQQPAPKLAPVRLLATPPHRLTLAQLQTLRARPAMADAYAARWRVCLF